ncbi:MAG TPA: Type 1 glutamine amidotransferase-like domain-containing protein [Gaiellaceae bacterium]|nr:Type 1 glutamine amidotransferase-like domain-containing protein [Gaiellaceae bacterium]
MVQVKQQILGLGGGGDTPEQTRALMRHALSLTGKSRPRVLHVPTATGDSDAGVVSFYERCHGLGDLSHLKFHPWPPAGLRELVLSQDAISVGGGSTANMLAVWRVHGFDRILREA